jgi:hypothetical protein
MPLILRPLFFDAATLADTLNLTPAIAHELADRSAADVRGKPRAVFVEADELPGSIRPSGTYAVEGKALTVTLVLSRDGRAMTRKMLKVSREPVSKTAKAIVDAIYNELGTQ